MDAETPPKSLIKIDMVTVGKELKFKIDFSGDVLREVNKAGKLQDLYIILNSIKCSIPVFLGDAHVDELKKRGIMYLFEKQGKQE